jgi:hypothetical protein
MISVYAPVLVSGTPTGCVLAALGALVAVGACDRRSVSSTGWVAGEAPIPIMPPS